MIGDINKNQRPHQASATVFLRTAFILVCSVMTSAESAANRFAQSSEVKAETYGGSVEQGVRAISSGAFLNSLGVNVHIAQGYPEANYATAVNYTGIRNIRDGYANLSRTLLLHHQAGVKLDLVGGCDLESTIASAEALASAGALLSIEGPNEPNNFPIQYDNHAGGGRSSWLSVAQCQKALFDSVKSNAMLRSVPVFAVSEAGAETDNVGLQYLTIPSGADTLMPDGTQYADYANPHNYVSGNINQYVDNQAWQAADPTFNGPWDGLYGEYGLTWSGRFKGYSNEQLQKLPRVTTETGWDSSVNPGGEQVQGKVLVNTFLSQFKRGWSLTFIYEMIDGEGSSGTQGLYTSKNSPKLSATYIHNLTTILADRDTPFRAGFLSYEIPNEPNTVHDLLLQKHDGTFDLVIWGESTKSTSNILVDIGKVHRNVRLYDVTSGASSVEAFGDVSKLTLPISDHAVILEIPG